MRERHKEELKRKQEALAAAGEHKFLQKVPLKKIQQMQALLVRRCRSLQWPSWSRRGSSSRCDSWVAATPCRCWIRKRWEAWQRSRIGRFWTESDKLQAEVWFQRPVMRRCFTETTARTGRRRLKSVSCSQKHFSISVLRVDWRNDKWPKHDEEERNRRIFYVKKPNTTIFEIIESHQQEQNEEYEDLADEYDEEEEVQDAPTIAERSEADIQDIYDKEWPRLWRKLRNIPLRRAIAVGSAGLWFWRWWRIWVRIQR